jgi:hypothetical protein
MRFNIDLRFREASLLECRIVAHRCLLTGFETSPEGCGGLLPGLKEILFMLSSCQGWRRLAHKG